MSALEMGVVGLTGGLLQFISHAHTVIHPCMHAVCVFRGAEKIRLYMTDSGELQLLNSVIFKKINK